MFIFQRRESTVSIMYSKSSAIPKRLKTDVSLDYFSHSDILEDSDHVCSFTTKPKPKKYFSRGVTVSQ